MKRRILLLIVILSTVCFTACQKNIPVHLPKPEYMITFSEEYLKQNGNTIKLLYPTVCGYPDSEKEASINRDSAEYAHTSYEKAGLIASDDGGYIYTAVEGTVLLETRDFYSVLISGTIESSVSGNTEIFFYVMNYDLTRNIFITTQSAISDYPSLAELFNTKSFEQDFGNSDLNDNFTRESLIQQYKADYGIYPEIYFREGKFGILVETLPSFGGYAGFLCDIQDVTSYLNTEDSIIASLWNRLKKETDDELWQSQFLQSLDVPTLEKALYLIS